MRRRERTREREKREKKSERERERGVGERGRERKRMVSLLAPKMKSRFKNLRSICELWTLRTSQLGLTAI